MNNKMFDMVFNLKFQAKTLNRQAAKCEKNEKVEKDKAFKAMKKNNMDGAQIHASNAIRLHNENLQFLRIASQCAPTPALVSRDTSLCTTPCPASRTATSLYLHGHSIKLAS